MRVERGFGRSGKNGSSDRRQKLRAIRVAASYSFPTADIDQMLAEIEAGRSSE